MKKSTVLSVLLSLFLSLNFLLGGVLIYQGHWLQTDLLALLPENAQQSKLQQLADQYQEQAFSQQIIALVGNADAEQAFHSAQQLARFWQQSAVFSQIESQITPDLAQLGQEIKQLRLAVLPSNIRQQLLTDPNSYFQHYAQQVVDPFQQQSLLPLEQDWLGFGRFVLNQSQPFSQLQWHSENGLLYLQQQGQTWVLLRGILPEQQFIQNQQGLLNLVSQSRQQLAEQHSQLLITGSALFGAMAKQQAENESSLMSLIGVSLTLLLLLAVFKTWRVLWLFLPIVAGMLTGVVSTVLVFGQIHLLTLVIGTSLIGILVDFPLHWLSSSLFVQPWQPVETMRKLCFTFLVSLFITLLGYGLLGFTALPVLKQSALFSAVALITAICTTLCYLPPLFKSYQCQPWTLSWRYPLPSLPRGFKRAVVLFSVLLIGVGIARSQWRDDIRQWVALPPDLLQQAQQISQLTGIDLGSQYLLVTATDDEQLLANNQQLSDQLATLQQQGKITGFRALSQWILPQQDQQQWREDLLALLQPQDYAILQEIGLPEEKTRQELTALLVQPTVSLAQALQTKLGEGWRSLYLGHLTPDHVASMIKISGIQDPTAVAALANNQDSYWQDKPSQLNQAFQHTRNQAAWLKLLSFALAGLLLWKIFGLRRTAKMLLIPLFAIVSTVAVFGWLGLPISLFVMFGLLLVSAISIDYTAYMQTAQEPLTTKRIAVSLASLTTMISFLLLSLSSTPAVAGFGLSVSLGVAISLFATLRLLR